MRAAQFCIRMGSLFVSGARPRAAERQRAVCSQDSYDKVYEELGLDSRVYSKVGGARCRQHVNPLKRELAAPAPALEWDEVYADPTRPLVLDVGSGYGRFLLALAHAKPGHNMLGLEIRTQALNRANLWAKELQLDQQVRFTCANATVSLETMLSIYRGSLDLVTIQFPDPHFKKRHHKRRVVQPQLVRALRELCAPGALILLSSDVLHVAEDMRDQFERHSEGVFDVSQAHHAPDSVFYSAAQPESGAAAAAAGPGSSSGSEPSQYGALDDSSDGEIQPAEQFLWAGRGWLRENPLGVPTEREVATMKQGLPVYRFMLRKRD